MIIYNTNWLTNLKIQDQAQTTYRAGDITHTELKNIEEKHPVGFYSPNVFIRTGLFLLTFIILGFAIGLLSLMLMDSKIVETPGYLVFLGIISYIALEVMIRQSHHYHSGVDDALIWTSAGLILTAYIWFLDNRHQQALNGHEEILISGFTFILAAYFTLRFADVLMAAISFAALIAFVFFGWDAIGFYSLASMPFLIMIFSAGIYFAATFNSKRTAVIFYENCLIILQVLSLLSCYLAGNYYVVRELGSEMSNATLAPGQGIPLGWFFWIWTIVLPFVYVGFGIKKKDVILLRSGLILIAGAAFTFRNYYHVMPIEATLSILGAALIAIAYSVIKYLKTPKHGFTYEELDEGHLMDNLQIESLIVAETFSGPQSTPDSSRMGGGSFGGGGASGDF